LDAAAPQKNFCGEYFFDLIFTIDISGLHYFTPYFHGQALKILFGVDLSQGKIVHDPINCTSTSGNWCLSAWMKKHQTIIFSVRNKDKLGITFKEKRWQIGNDPKKITERF